MTQEDGVLLNLSDDLAGMQRTDGWKHLEGYIKEQAAQMVNDLVTYAKPVNEELWRMKGVIQGLNIAIGYIQDVHNNAQEVREKKEKENA